jgi:hypothetical protein
MKKAIGTMMVLAAFPALCIGGTYEIMFKLVAVGMLLAGAWMADLFDDEATKSENRLAHDDGEFKMPEE